MAQSPGSSGAPEEKWALGGAEGTDGLGLDGGGGAVAVDVFLEEDMAEELDPAIRAGGSNGQCGLYGLTKMKTLLVVRFYG